MSLMVSHLYGVHTQQTIHSRLKLNLPRHQHTAARDSLLNRLLAQSQLDYVQNTIITTKYQLRLTAQQLQNSIINNLIATVTSSAQIDCNEMPTHTLSGHTRSAIHQRDKNVQQTLSRCSNMYKISAADIVNDTNRIRLERTFNNKLNGTLGNITISVSTRNL